MKKFFAWMGYVPASEIAVSHALNMELRNRLKESEERLLTLAIENDRLTQEHGQLTEHHEKVKRGASVLALAVQRMNGMPQPTNAIRTALNKRF